MAPPRRLVVGAVALSALLVAACQSVHSGTVLSTPANSLGPTPSAARANMIIDQAGPPPVVLEDTSPGQLAAQVNLTMGGYDPATRDLAELSIVFLHQGQWVRFVRGERLTCNGTILPGPGTAFDLKVPAATIGGKQVACTYVSGGKSATLVFTAPPMPTLVAPADASRIVRSHTTPVRFRVGGQNTMFYITALGAGSKSWVFPWGDPPTRGPANPSTQATLDTSALAAGPGSINLVQSFTLEDLRGVGFQSADGSGDAVSIVSVTWD
jgi:hypothetical protein